MKTTLILILIATFSIKLRGQSTNTNIEKMKLFKVWEGTWEGEGSMQMGPGESKKTKVQERIEYKLDGTILMVEGVGKVGEKKIHHALGILSYNENKNEYEFNTYLNDGKNSNAWFSVIDTNKYQWGFDVPTGKIRYSIRIDTSKNTWNEIGEFSKDGTQWWKYFEMNLTQVTQ